MNHVHLLGADDAALGKAILYVRLFPLFYAEFDPIFRGNNPKVDASAVAQELLDQKTSSISAEKLENKLGWDDRRRFNPAFALVVENISAKHKGTEINPDYPTKSVVLLPEVRAYLERFINMCT